MRIENCIRNDGRYFEKESRQNYRKKLRNLLSVFLVGVDETVSM